VNGSLPGSASGVRYTLSAQLSAQLDPIATIKREHLRNDAANDLSKQCKQQAVQ
jgi:hypothetical protein